MTMDCRKWAAYRENDRGCIKVCDYGVNLCFLLNVARVTMARLKSGPRLQRKLGTDGFRLVTSRVTQRSCMQFTDVQLTHVGQDRSGEPGVFPELPEVMFYTSRKCSRPRMLCFSPSTSLMRWACGNPSPQVAHRSLASSGVSTRGLS